MRFLFMRHDDWDRFIKVKDKYILDEDNNVIPANLLEWSEFFENSIEKRRVCRVKVNDYLISTVFLGIDYNWLGKIYEENPNPHVFETMIFSGDESHEIYCARCSTWKEAQEEHKKAIKWILNRGKEEEGKNEI